MIGRILVETGNYNDCLKAHAITAKRSRQSHRDRWLRPFKTKQNHTFCHFTQCERGPLPTRDRLDHEGVKFSAFRLTPRCPIVSSPPSQRFSKSKHHTSLSAPPPNSALRIKYPRPSLPNSATQLRPARSLTVLGSRSACSLMQAVCTHARSTFR